MKYLILALITTPLYAQISPDYTKWAILDPTLGSTTGKAMISGYIPKVTGNRCATDFTTTETDGRVSYNIAEFDAVPMQDGILCKNGRFRAKDGSASGTTPLEVFIKDGVLRRSP